MPTSNEWLTPYQRSYNSIKTKLLNSLRSKVPEITDYTEGNIFIILISMFAAIAEVIHYYIDNMARETFFPTARKYSSLYKHAKLVDYHIKCAVPASVDIIFSLDGGPEADTLIPENTQFEATDGSVWITSRSVTWPKGVPSCSVPLIQKERSSTEISLGYITSKDVSISLGDIGDNKYYAEGSMKLTIGGEAWTLVDTFAYSNATDKVYKIEPDSNQVPKIIFGNGIQGMIPDMNLEVKGTYWITLGQNGNIPADSFKTIPDSLDAIKGTNTVIYQPYAATGGSNYESFAMLKDHIPLSLKTLGVAITKEDFEAVAKMVPGVNKAYCEYICGQVLNLIISPDEGIEASSTLMQQVMDTISKAKVITTSVSVQSTHKTLIYIDAAVYGRPSFSKNDIAQEVKDTLLENYNQNTSNIQQIIRLSDIYALIDNIDIVDYVDINKIYLMSYPRSNRATVEEQGFYVVPLDVVFFNQLAYNPITDLLEGDIDEIYLRIVMEGENPDSYTIKVSDSEGNSLYEKDEYQFDTQYTVNLENTQNRVAFQINIGDQGYTAGPDLKDGVKQSIEYTITLQPMNVNLTPVDYNIPIFESSSINLTVYESV